MDSGVSAFEASSRSCSSCSSNSSNDGRKHCSPSSGESHKEGLKAAASPKVFSGEDSPPSADSVREEGLRAFRAGDWRGATDAWSRGLRTLEYILARADEFDENKKNEFFAMRQSYFLNLSLSTLKEGRWAACILYSDKALQHDPTCVKALYRKAQAQQELGEYDAALATVEKFLQASPGNPLALSLQSQLRHLKAAYKAKQKKCLEGMFRVLEHDPRSETAAAANVGGAQEGEGLFDYFGKKIKGWFGGSGVEERFGARQEEQKGWNERLAALSETFSSPAAGGSAAGRKPHSSGEESHQAAVMQALSALAGQGGFHPGPAGGSADLEKMARLVEMHQRLSTGGTTFVEKLMFGLRLVWFGVKQLCSRTCGHLCKRRQIPQQVKGGFKGEETELRNTAPPPLGASLKGRKSKTFVSSAQRRQQCRTTAAAAARRLVRQQHASKGMGSGGRVEDIDELEGRDK